MEIAGFTEVFVALTSKIFAIFLCLLTTLTYFWWVLPNHKLRSLKRCGFGGPKPSFPHGNAKDMKRKESTNSSFGSSNLSHDIHSAVSPYYSTWQKLYGKVFVYWLGTEPFLYVADPEFLKKMNAKVLAKTWGKPSVFRKDRFPMFGNGLVMAEGNKWVQHRHVIAPTFSPINLKAMAGMMVDSTRKMMNRWISQVNSGNPEINVEKEIIATAGEIIARASFGMGDENGKKVFEKLRTLQMALFMTNRHVGVPFGKFLNLKKTLETKKLGEEIDKLLLSIIKARVNSDNEGQHQQDLLGHLLQDNDGVFSMRELVDECKTFFFGGYETTALSITWTLLILSVQQDWQDMLRDEIKEVVGNIDELDINNMLADLKKVR
ncbi:cytokinin hydroxylase-like [Lotus japonicus]|uniref:cytokinin hydroxylase-like n=1 Tax=Lotus japonicus TaxID=34305 RepID=UPI00258EDD76|nr:cytokinin hydroxylase-like [Lotus japonicus]